MKEIFGTFRKFKKMRKHLRAVPQSRILNNPVFNKRKAPNKVGAGEFIGPSVVRDSHTTLALFVYSRRKQQLAIQLYTHGFQTSFNVPNVGE